MRGRFETGRSARMGLSCLPRAGAGPRALEELKLYDLRRASLSWSQRPRSGATPSGLRSRAGERKKQRVSRSDPLGPSDAWQERRKKQSAVFALVGVSDQSMVAGRRSSAPSAGDAPSRARRAAAGVGLAMHERERTPICGDRRRRGQGARWKHAPSAGDGLSRQSWAASNRRTALYAIASARGPAGAPPPRHRLCGTRNPAAACRHVPYRRFVPHDQPIRRGR